MLLRSVLIPELYLSVVKTGFPTEKMQQTS